MDFDLHFTEEDERFRTEVRKWLEENAPADMEWPPDPYDSKPEMVQKRTDMTRKLGAKGWYAPDWPKEYGGGGLSGERVTILQQEFNRISEERGWGGVFGFTSDIVPGTLLKYGPEELRREILTGILRGEISWWLNETEPEHGTDNAALESTAIQDGDHYIVNGEKIYVGREEPVNWRDTWLFTPLVTKPGAPRHENLGTFVFPANLPGIEAEVLPLIGAEAIKWRLHMKNVRVPAKYLIGGPEANGWEVLQYSLRAEHGGGGRIATRPSLSSKLIRYCKEAKRNGKPLSSDPFVQDTLVRLWIEDEKARLYGLSTYWTGKSGE